MQDPHVVALNYRLEPIVGVTYESPPDVRVRQPAFEGTLADGRFVARMTQHFPSETDARLPVDAFLRAWEIYSGVQLGRIEAHFRFERSEIVDRAPPVPGVIRANIRAVLPSLTATGRGTVRLARRSYPKPPTEFSVDPLVETLWRRYESHLQGREPLFSMAYFCLTAIERDAGSKKKAAVKFAIDLKVLSTLGQLSSSRGDATEARKVVGSTLQPASGAEVAWLQGTITALVGQVASLAAGVAPPQLSMSALPRL